MVSSFVPSPLQDKLMSLRIQQDEKFHSFLKGIGLRPLARKEAAQALTQMRERSQGVATSEGSLLQLAYQETRESVTFFARDLANRVVDGERPLYVTTFLRASQIKRTLVDTDASTSILSLHIKCLRHSTRKNHLRATSSGKDRIVAAMHSGTCILGFESRTHQGKYSYACKGW